MTSRRREYLSYIEEATLEGQIPNYFSKQAQQSNPTSLNKDNYYIAGPYLLAMATKHVLIEYKHVYKTLFAMNIKIKCQALYTKS